MLLACWQYKIFGGERVNVLERTASIVQNKCKLHPMAKPPNSELVLCEQSVDSEMRTSGILSSYASPC